ncbi:hypothetical protein MLD38_030094 [Melastoma candidum]|uniref:Uncharacterized protein n=1 Tax=Melastoma candidum TaxID=119954 RepID=A0ACB9MKS5_9MYRT|nr:hypothetical protein MLD38_030094 [Melastoma candidum]
MSLIQAAAKRWDVTGRVPNPLPAIYTEQLICLKPRLCDPSLSGGDLDGVHSLLNLYSGTLSRTKNLDLAALYSSDLFCRLTIIPFNFDCLGTFAYLGERKTCLPTFSKGRLCPCH